MATKINREALRQRIKELAGLTDDERAALLELVNTKKYGLVWENHPEDVEERLRTSLPVLEEVKERYIPGSTPDSPNHILIEGDNLEALTALTYTHEGKIDVIYIDPPYNRGENDFMYNDKYIDKDNPFKHSLWLSFMKKRMKLAKILLNDMGVLIIHIDEHEFDALHLLLENDIFDSSQNLGLIIWNKMNPKGDALSTATMHEYILLFCKNRKYFALNENNMQRDKANAKQIIAKGKSLISKIGTKDIPDDLKQLLKSYKYPKSLIDQLEIDYDYEMVCQEFQSWINKSPFSKGEKAYKYLDIQGDVFRTVSMAWPNKETAPEDYWKPLTHPVTGETCPLPSRGWRNPTYTMEKLLGEKDAVNYCGLTIKGEIAFSVKKNGQLNIPERVYYLKDNMKENVPSIYNDGSSDDQLLSDLNISFPYPKTLSVAQYLLKNVYRNNNITVLDFFAGSGTTMHAVMQLNKEDGGHRQCILVTNNENNICEEVTYERNKRVINGYTTPKGVEVEGLHNNSLRYYKTKLLPRQHTNRNMHDLMNSATDLLCIKENLYDETPIHDLPIKNIRRHVRLYGNDKRRMLIIYNEEAIQRVVPWLATLPPTPTKIKVYTFSYSNYAYDDDFAEVEDRVQLCALPAAIYEAYRRVLPKENRYYDDEPIEGKEDEA